MARKRKEREKKKKRKTGSKSEGLFGGSGKSKSSFGGW